jgi:acyl-coenzyme A synthetase/AMP-(fatty) acid ligase
VAAREQQRRSEISYCKERLANFKVPREVTFVDELPRNLSGKILKRDLRLTAEVQCVREM